MKFKLNKASKVLISYCPTPCPQAILSWTSTAVLLLLSGKPYNAPVKFYLSLKPSSNAAGLLYEDFVPSSIVAFSRQYLIISPSLSSPVRLQNLLGIDWVTSVYSQPQEDSRAPVTRNTEGIQYTCKTWMIFLKIQGKWEKIERKS